MKKINFYISLLLTLICFVSCDDYLDVKPKDKVRPTTADEFRALLTRAYSKVPSDKAKLALRTDELILNTSVDNISNVKDIFMWNDIDYSTSSLSFSWEAYYSCIMYTNHIIHEGLNATRAKEDVVKQIVGEAFLYRAYLYFCMVNQYGHTYNKATAKSDKGIPLSLEIDMEAKLSASSVEEVYTQILKDIDQGLLNMNVVNYEAGENYRFSILAAKAFKARLYLYMNDFDNARKFALEVLTMKNDLVDLNADASVFPNKYNSVESILALENVNSADVTLSTYVSDKLLSAYDRDNDLRFNLFYNISTKNDTKYIFVKGTESESRVTFRTSEMVLIVAEVAAQNNELKLANEYLNKLKLNRLKPDFYNTEVLRTKDLSKDDLLKEISQERVREFACEGHRWFDLRRTQTIKIEHSYKEETSTLKVDDIRYTIRYPKEAILANPSLKN